MEVTSAWWYSRRQIPQSNKRGRGDCQSKNLLVSVKYSRRPSRFLAFVTTRRHVGSKIALLLIKTIFILVRGGALLVAAINAGSVILVLSYRMM